MVPYGRKISRVYAMTVLLHGLSLITDLHGTSVYLFGCVWISWTPQHQQTDLYQCLRLCNWLRILYGKWMMIPTLTPQYIIIIALKLFIHLFCILCRVCTCCIIYLLFTYDCLFIGLFINYFLLSFIFLYVCMKYLECLVKV